MRVQIDTSTPFEFREGDFIPPLGLEEEYFIVVDQSKTNGAHLLMSPDGRGLHIVQTSGNDRKFYSSPQEDKEYFNDLFEFFTKWLSGTKPLGIFPEEPVDSKAKGNFHTKRTLFALCEIYRNIADEFKCYYEEINNWSWKNSILPKGYRGMYDSKGSYRFITEQHPELRGISHDVTDAVCMGMHVCRKYYSKYKKLVQPLVGKPPTPHSFEILPQSPVNSVEFRYNAKMSLEEIAESLSIEGDVCHVPLPVTKVTIQEIIQYGKSLSIDTPLILVVRRK